MSYQQDFNAGFEEELEDDIDQGIIRPVPLQADETKNTLVKRLIGNIREQLEHLERMLDSESEIAEIEAVLNRRQTMDGEEFVSSSVQSRTVDGVFDGESMVGEDGRKYSVPPNYASKSKLVEGDLLRLVITDNGRFIFKQKGPIERQRVMGNLSMDEQQNEWRVVANGHKYRVLPASISYYKGQVGDDIVVLVPKGGESRWAAVENIIRKDAATFAG